jgi:aspartyl-tRNA(Asn)/glutamyl-tRNA(Gln) amidotransferase subunit B
VAAAISNRVDPRLALTRAANEVAGRTVNAAAFTAPFTKTLMMEQDGRLTATQAKRVLARVILTGGDPASVAREMGFEAMAADTLRAAVESAIAAHPAAWDRYRTGEDKLAGFFVGKVMAATAGKADGKAVTAWLRQRRQS